MKVRSIVIVMIISFIGIPNLHAQGWIGVYDQKIKVKNAYVNKTSYSYKKIRIYKEGSGTYINVTFSDPQTGATWGGTVKLNSLGSQISIEKSRDQYSAGNNIQFHTLNLTKVNGSIRGSWFIYAFNSNNGKQDLHFELYFE